MAIAGWWLVLLARRRRWALTGATAAAAAVRVRPQTAVVVALPLLHVAVALTNAEQRWGLPSGLLVGFVTVACAVVAAPGVEVRPGLAPAPRGCSRVLFRHRPPTDGASAFSWPHQRLFARAGRGRYLHVAVAPLPPEVVLGAGFYGQEMDRSRAPEGAFHWMGRHGVLVLSPSGSALRLKLDLVVPVPKLAVRGAILGSFVATASRHSKKFDIARSLLHPERPTEMVITATHTFVPAARGEGEDRCVLGLQVRNPRLQVLAGLGEADDGGR